MSILEAISSDDANTSRFGQPVESRSSFTLEPHSTIKNSEVNSHLIFLKSRLNPALQLKVEIASQEGVEGVTATDVESGISGAGKSFKEAINDLLIGLQECRDELIQLRPLSPDLEIKLNRLIAITR